MNLNDLEKSLVKIQDSQGNTFGTGFFIAKNLIVTCAHVVQACGGSPGQEIDIESYISGFKCKSTVMDEFWAGEKLDENPDDIALLQLDFLSVCDDIAIADLGASKNAMGHNFKTFGFAELEGNYNGAWTSGEIRGVVPHPDKNPMLQIDAKPILRGMSGAPVFDLVTEQVVGIVNEFDARSSVQWATTSETLERGCSALHLLKIQIPGKIRTYINAVNEYCKNLPYLTLANSQRLKLNDIYIPLGIRKIGAGAKSDSVENYKISSVNIKDVLADSNQRIILLLGEPGSGKSTILRQLAEQCWENHSALGLNTPHIPLLTSFVGFAAGQGSVEQRFSQSVEAQLGLNDDLPDEFFSKWAYLANGAWLILIDGFDELYSKNRLEVVQSIKNWLVTNKDCRIIITSRPSGYRNEFDDLISTQYEILPFNSGQIKEFAHRWIGEKAQDFNKEIARESLLDVLSTPLMLTVAANVFLEHGKLPGNKVQIYDIFINQALEEGGTKLRNDMGARTEDVWRVAYHILTHLAWELTLNPDAEEKILSRVIEDYLLEALSPISKDMCKQLSLETVKLLSIRSGIFVFTNGKYGFVHPTIREYLAAVSLVQKSGDDPDLLWNILSKNLSWQDIGIFSYSIICQNNMLSARVVEKILNSGKVGILFAGKLLVNQVSFSEDIESEVIERLFDNTRIENSYESLSVLSQLLPRKQVIQDMVAISGDKWVDIFLREISAEYLTAADLDEAFLAWASILADYSVDDMRRVKAGYVYANFAKSKNAQVALEEAVDGLSKISSDSADPYVQDEILDICLELGMTSEELSDVGIHEGNFYEDYSYEDDYEDDSDLVGGDKKVDRLIAIEEWDSIYKIVINQNANFEQRLYALDALIENEDYHYLFQVASNRKIEPQLRENSVDALAGARVLDLLAEIVTSEPRSSTINYYTKTSIRYIIQNIVIMPEIRLRGISVFVQAKDIEVLFEICKDISLEFRMRAEAVKGLQKLGAKNELETLKEHADPQLTKILENALRDI